MSEKNMSEKTGVAVLILVSLVAVGGLLLHTNESTTALVPAQKVWENNCRLVDANYKNCVSHNGGCSPGYPDFKQYNFNVKGIMTCCCVPYNSNYK
ncbi:MAG: hypothetical protein HY363_05605 [Candidatus Aenigmarchaeota archaeon]|nr:hypothetical protein [Candidatus Aenigmarchaeota archaeon]